MEKQIYDSIRRQWVAAQPEEIVRQMLIQDMIQRLGYPQALIAVEKGLKEMPHLALEREKIPLRRADIVCFARDIHPRFELFPLLMIECKAVKITEQVIRQVVGYNHYLQAHFIAVANQDEIRTGWFDRASRSYQFISGLPSFTDLVNALQKLPR